MSRKRLSGSHQLSPLSPVVPICPASSSPASPQVGSKSLSFSRQPRETSDIKLLLVGDAGVGKTAMILGFCGELPTKSQLHIMSLTKDSPCASASGVQRMRNVTKKRYSLNDYEELFQSSDELEEYVLDTKATIGVDIKTTLLNIDSRLFKCTLWDTAGQERYRNAMIPALYRDAHGIVLTYDLCNSDTLDSISSHWMQEALDNCGSSDLARVRFYLVGNKLDLTKQRKVTQDQVIKAVAFLQSHYHINISGTFEVTCKWPNVVDRTFTTLVRDLVASGCYDTRKYSEVPQRRTKENKESDQSGGDDNSYKEHDRGLGLRRHSTTEGKNIPGGIDLTRPYHIGKHTSTCCM
ncbi:YPT11 (YNL304W) [Zygosaccharomyces parabailii]|nr:YPT11 (YNL304W) [Zygosaccharomyces parabailii]